MQHTNEEKILICKLMAEIQRHYDFIHHEMRIHYLQARTESLDHFEFGLLSQSIFLRENRAYGNRSVNLKKSEYLKELDIFALEHKVLTGHEKFINENQNLQKYAVSN